MKYREDCMFLGGDFNGRIEERGARNWEEEGGGGKKIQRQGGKCRGEETDEMDSNGKKQGDEELERINIGSGGETVIDYGIVSEEAWERVEEFRIGERVESGLLPLEISIRNEP
jgi:hypothetical protein